MGILNWLFDTPEKVGKEGERNVEKEINIMNFFTNNGKVIKNIYIPKGNGETTEIDILFITYCGVFVIEVKNYNGYIFGNENNKNWVKTVYRGKNFLGMNKVEKIYFYNPIWQNKTHIKYLKKYLGDNIQFFSGIVFTGNSEIKNVEIFSDETFVCHKNELIRILKRIIKAYPKIFNKNDIKDIYNDLKNLNNDKIVKKQHIKSINEPKDDKCPRCGGDLVLRVAQKGKNWGSEFFGCSNYPNCKYTRNKY